MKSDNIRLAIPSKGRLKADTTNWFARSGVEIVLSESEREYKADIKGLNNMEVILMSAGEIPTALRDGQIDLGVTGQDMIQEKIADWSNFVREYKQMGFGFADLVLAVPTSWVDVFDLDDLDAVFADIRKKHGHRARIATKYHRLVGTYLRAAEVTNFQLVDSQGATEGVVANETAEMIADITSTGATLHANHLKIIGEPILKSQACLFGATKLPQEKSAPLSNLMTILNQS